MAFAQCSWLKRSELDAIDDRFLDVLTEGFVLQDAGGTIVRFNRAALTILGSTALQLSEATSYDPSWNGASEDSSALSGSEHPAMVTLRTGVALEKQTMGVDDGHGTRKWLSINTLPLRGSDGHAVEGVISLFTDVTARIAAERQVQSDEVRFQEILENAPIGMTVVGLDGRFLHVNEALCRITGYSAAELLTLRFQHITHPDDLDADLSNLRRLGNGEIRSYQMEKRYVRKDGTNIWILLSASALRDATENIVSYIGQVLDISDSKAAMLRLSDMTRYDALTGVLNRRALEADVPELLRDAACQESELCVVMADVDRFKAVNDTFGHDAGDEVLRNVAAGIKRHIRRSDRLYRYGGEEFLIVFAGSHDAALGCLDRIRSHLEETATRFRGAHIAATLSFGVSVWSVGASPEQLIRSADAALYRAKRKGRNRIEVGV